MVVVKRDEHLPLSFCLSKKWAAVGGAHPFMACGSRLKGTSVADAIFSKYWGRPAFSAKVSVAASAYCASFSEN